MRIFAWCKAAVRSVLAGVLYYTALDRLLARLLPCNAAAVIMYHGVCSRSDMPEEINFHVTPEEFERHMRLLKSRYPVISLDELVERLAQGRDLGKSVVLTFDDGYQNNALHVAPVLRRYHLPGTIFLTTAFIGSPNWLPLNELYALWAAGKIPSAEVGGLRERIRLSPASSTAALVEDIRQRSQQLDRAVFAESFAMLSWDEVRELDGAEITFGSHTQTHCSMAAEPMPVRSRELKESREIMERELGHKVSTFAYPYGRPPYINHDTKALIQEAGYSCALLTESALVTPQTDPYRISRICLHRASHQLAFELLYQFGRHAWKTRFSGRRK